MPVFTFMYTFVLFMVICVKIKMSTQKKGDILCSFGFYEVIIRTGSEYYVKNNFARREKHESE